MGERKKESYVKKKALSVRIIKKEKEEESQMLQRNEEDLFLLHTRSGLLSIDTVLNYAKESNNRSRFEKKKLGHEFLDPVGLIQVFWIFFKKKKTQIAKRTKIWNACAP